ncbi:MAG: hypothetical protein Q9227_001420 [Pyrenula ochraceoflavens]
MPGADTEDLLGAVHTIFSRHLKGRWTRERTPYGFDKALENAQSAAEDTTQRVFLDTKFQCWLAYFLATTGQGRHYSGQAAEAETISAFNKLPVSVRRDFAHGLADVVPDPSVEEALAELSARPQARLKRRRIMINSSSLQQTEILSPTVVPDSSRQEGMMNGESATLDINEYQDCVSDPPIAHLADVFRPYMCAAVVKRNDRAAITMIFPNFRVGPVVCLMSLAIYPNKVEYLALELFGVHIESEAGLRYIFLENGGRINPSPDIVLQGAREESILRLLGPQLTHAIMSSPTRKEEMRQGISLTRCLSMTVNAKADAQAILSLNTGLDDSFELKATLYRQ